MEWKLLSRYKEQSSIPLGIYVSECFWRETVLDLGIATLLFADTPTGYPKNRKRAGGRFRVFRLSFSPVSPHHKETSAVERGIAKSWLRNLYLIVAGLWIEC